MYEFCQQHVHVTAADRYAEHFIEESRMPNELFDWHSVTLLIANITALYPTSSVERVPVAYR
jgi:hypothetical protein